MIFKILGRVGVWKSQSSDSRNRDIFVDQTNTYTRKRSLCRNTRVCSNSRSMMKNVIYFVSFFTIGTAAFSAEVDRKYLGEWVPTSTTSISITGPISVKANQIIFNGLHEMKISYRRQREIMTFSYAQHTVDEFFIDGPAVIEGLRGNSLKEERENIILLRTEGLNRLVVYFCNQETLDKMGTEEVVGCSSYGYERKNLGHVS
ncbi:hypothetical protein IFT84_12265 [Rhizobium sp. CFBP 8762]|uniref:hypothetical protein n=1 Tax=Rhizobium sp. CFBP 8762 TaxID=2775279 RepID=UPI0017827D53|nr:hypothetical protein [Rhizobium sp. CFBP 8762]MBD8555281.1 hypothetical protein [Rhizobium sp. CFBP 8762]